MSLPQGVLGRITALINVCVNAESQYDDMVIARQNLEKAIATCMENNAKRTRESAKKALDFYAAHKNWEVTLPVGFESMTTTEVNLLPAATMFKPTSLDRGKLARKALKKHQWRGGEK